MEQVLHTKLLFPLPLAKQSLNPFLQYFLGGVEATRRCEGSESVPKMTEEIRDVEYDGHSVRMIPVQVLLSVCMSPLTPTTICILTEGHFITPGPL